MLNPLFRACLFVPVVSLVAACAPYVRSDVNRTLVSSVQCHTFAWAGAFHGNSPLRDTVANPLNESRLRAAIAAHLSGGIQPDAKGADCLVGYGIGSHTVVDWGGPYAWDYPYGWWGYPYGWGWWGAGPYPYHEGIIAVDLYDAKSSQPLWHASVEESLYGVDGTEAEKRINAAVAAIFSKYPYPGATAPPVKAPAG
jgi:hypothetical protein